MKILYITSVLGDIGGSEIYCRDIIKEMLRKGHKVLVVSTEPYDFRHKNAEVFLLPVFGHHAFHKFTAPLFYSRIVKKAVEFRPDVIQSHSNCLMGWIGDKVKKKLNIPHVLLIEMISAKNNNLHTKTIFALEKFLLPKLNYDKLVVWTENMKQKFLLPWGIEEKRIQVIPAALNKENYDLNASGKKVKKKYGDHLIVSIKSLWTTNVLGLVYIVKAMKYVKEKHPEYKYLCIGPGDSGALKKVAEEEKVEDVVLFLGSVSNEEKQEYWAATEIAPHSYVYEFSTSISLLEFLAMGKACVITDIGAVREYLKDAALIVKAEDPKALGEGINKLIENKELRKSLEKKARKLFEEDYSITSTVNRLEKIYLK
ncbi:glycosyltransferase family 4 protein [Candidatus Micrarchaeota archaeon]|nr:glycosyltransferase family 4 protein [Candidatus Micrarchaeota archaeon]MBU2476461.1 glycosyltransferase family 4 protein [Candidatus Micrarchaeota archaeon]